MLRCFLLTVASFAVRAVDPASLNIGELIPLSTSQLATLVRCLKWGLPLWALADFNSALNRWALNRWIWKNDTSGWEWKREIAVVTGGSAGIGACVVKKLVSHQIKVAVLDVGPLSESFTAEERAYIHYYKCDVASRDEIHTAAEAIRSDMGNPSILINNAGIGNSWTIVDIPLENLRKLFDINLLSHWSTVQEFLPDMLAKKKGHIMSVASLASFVALAGGADYSCTKAALLAFHEALTQELKHRHKCPQIKTSIVHPGWTKTAITAHPSVEAGLKRIRVRLLEPEDVAEAMVSQIIAAKNGQIVLGPKLAPSIRALPLWLQEVIRDSQANVVTLHGSTARE
ncbi:hypothetical protein BKA66DRAFT_511665 [Pyrenochaeta sp. MPI-SDFR-AT-0127]|nr:hypothetical protein BKA66DRAFT_511665 [Pyrenochaeta sp. MPI-SDFR-AT-0127]